MTLKTKRNLPLVLLLIGVLLFMAITMGNQVITSYTVTPATVQAWTADLTVSLMAAQ
ncbi:MAG: hypothetical protein HYZ24_07350 [Chloroflexi bacterium]|nr:hypothetical protein [Chloroflexota bacterium]